MTARDAYLFPVIGSAVLCSLYLLFKFLDKDHVNVLLTAYASPQYPALTRKATSFCLASLRSCSPSRRWLRGSCPRSPATARR